MSKDLSRVRGTPWGCIWGRVLETEVQNVQRWRELPAVLGPGEAKRCPG